MELTQISSLHILRIVSGLALAIIIFKKIFSTFTSKLAATGDGSTKLLPRGSFGFPFIGETIQFVISDPVAFCKPRMEKYGEVFKTHLLGRPTIIVTCPDLAKYIFVDSKQQFAFKYPFYFDQLLGDGGPGYQPETRQKLHRAAKIFFSPDVLRLKVADMESMTLDTLRSWATLGTVKSAERECIKFSMSVGIHLLLGLKSDHPFALKLQHYYEKHGDGLKCLPITLPGTQYSRALKAKEIIQKELEIFIEKRANSLMHCASTNQGQRDLLDVILQDSGKGHGASGVAQYFVLLLFGARDTVGYTILWAIMSLCESSEVLQAVTMENNAIRQRKEPGAPLTWSDFKDMKYSLRVVQELLRISSVATAPTRKALEDVHFNGCVIPKNWNVMIMLPAIHKNAKHFPNPTRFNPSRFEKAPIPNTFLPFGSGRHACSGIELAKMEVLIVLHVLTTQFCWERIGKNCGTVSYPWPAPRDGFPIKIKSKIPADG